jgi:hypothetical protein
MKKTLVSALAAAMLLTSAASAANLMLDEKSKTYDFKQALQEINESMTAVGTVETDTAKISIKPFFHSHIMSGSSISRNGLPFQKPKSMLEKANGYVFKAVGKSFATEAYPLAGVFMMVENKKDEPLVIDMNNSALQVGNFYGQPFYSGKFMDQGRFTQPNLIIPPKQSKSVLLYRSDAEYIAVTLCHGWFLKAEPVDFNKIHAEVALKIGDKYVTVSADGAIPENIQKKYDQAAQMAAK